MQELISKEAVLEALSDMSRGYSIAREEIKALPTTVHHEYKVGNLKLIEAEEAIKLLVEYSDKLPQWLLEKMSNLPIYENEYKVGDIYEFSNDWKDWERHEYRWISYGVLIETDSSKFSMQFRQIRPLSPEHPDIIQARELASKHWMILIPKE